MAAAKKKAKDPVEKDEPVGPPSASLAAFSAVSFVENVLMVDLTALEALPQGERQAVLKVARGVLDRANQ